jgi:integrase/recombinase XerC
MSTPDLDILEDYLEHLATIGRSPKTIRTYGTALRAAHRELPAGVPTATAAEITAWLGRYASAATRRTYHAAIRGLTSWSVAVGHISRDEGALVPRPRVRPGLPNPCSDAELATILARAAEPYRLWSLLAAYAGARCIEITRLQLEHVTLERLELHGKGDKIRRVPTHPLIWAAVEGLPPGPVAPGRDPWRDQVSAELRRAYLALGVDVTAHQLRHWYGTSLVASGAGLEEVRELMGHASISTTLGYVRVASPRLAAAVGRLPALASI